MYPNFIDLCTQGKTKISEIDDWVDSWQCFDDGRELHEFLGMSEYEYEMWVLDDSYLEYIIEDRKRKEEK